MRITYTVASHSLVFDYRIKASVADLFVTKFHDWVPGAVVTLDDRVTDELPVIPCARLWEP